MRSEVSDSTLAEWLLTSATSMGSVSACCAEWSPAATFSAQESDWGWFCSVLQCKNRRRDNNKKNKNYKRIRIKIMQTLFVFFFHNFK
jgi:hypothetical protein